MAEGEEVGAAVPSSSQRRGTRSWMFDGARTLDDVLDRLDDMERVSEARSAAQALAQQHVLAATAHAQRGAAAGAASSSSSRPGSAAAFCASGGIATALDAAAASHRAFESRVADDLAGLQAALQSLLDPSSPRNYNEVFSVTDKARELIRSHMQRSKAAAAERTRLLTAQAQELERNIAALSAAGPGAVREARRSAARRLRDRRTSEFDELRASMAKLRSSVDASIARLTADFENGPGASAAAADDLRRLTIREDEDDDDENEDDDKDAYGGEDDGLGASNDDDDGDGLDSVSAGEEDDEGSSSLGGEDEEPGEEGEPRAGARRGSRLDTRVARDAARSSNSSGSRLATAGSAVAHRPERAAMKAFKSSSLPPNPFA